MLGKKKNVKVVKKLLVEILGTKLSSWTTTEFCQGHTMRWGIAWTTIQGWKLEKVKLSPFVLPLKYHEVPNTLTSGRF